MKNSPRDIRNAARLALQGLDDDAEVGTSDPTPRIDAITVHMQHQGQPQVVVLRPSMQQLHMVSTEEGARNSPCLVTALRLLARESGVEPAGNDADSHPSMKRRYLAETQTALVPIAPDFLEKSESENLISLLDDILLAIVRVGTEHAADAPSVEEAMQRLIQGVGNLSWTLQRWIGRLRSAMRQNDGALVTALLWAASQWIGDLKSPKPSDQRWCERMTCWLDHQVGEGPRQIEDRCLLEIGRERLTGVGRVHLERRYLIDIEQGELFREEVYAEPRTRSLGPCPRQVMVGLAEVDAGPPPRRIRILQYAVDTLIDTALLNTVEGFALTDFNHVLARYEQSQQIFGPVFEPFVVLRPSSWRCVPELVLIDDSDSASIKVLDVDGVDAMFIRRQLETSQLHWVAGKLARHEGKLALQPLSVTSAHVDHKRYTRLR